MPFQFKIQIKDIIKPPVWRRLLVPENFTFYQFHLIIQAAFDWQDAHAYEFSPDDRFSNLIIADKELYDIDFFEDDELIDSKEIKLADIFKAEGQKFVYTYDLGDNWEHLITSEKITGEKLFLADCLAGKGNCPPEDCGGPWGYEELKVALADPKHREHKEFRKWLGLKKNEDWDFNFFSLKEAQEAVRNVDFDQENNFELV
ncbi:plasmid pRiA4b ORF-3 family protein [uncultured Mucilaginibacter sp.]|uniref:plasmid pRiA4b ORF-3 family protein n=1 Tax=uncultured Mucilaginibacter sp. TaxID=797541 RepID=UPI00261BAD6A|nr:plasmid pRiA4b ORF-3 family protein [uncultured Mucilaginibacter sp.]